MWRNKSLEKAKRCLHLKVPLLCENLVKKIQAKNIQERKSKLMESNKTKYSQKVALWYPNSPTDLFLNAKK